MGQPPIPAPCQVKWIPFHPVCQNLFSSAMTPTNNSQRWWDPIAKMWRHVFMAVLVKYIIRRIFNTACSYFMRSGYVLMCWFPLWTWHECLIFIFFCFFQIMCTLRTPQATLTWSAESKSSIRLVVFSLSFNSLITCFKDNIVLSDLIMFYCSAVHSNQMCFSASTSATKYSDWLADISKIVC